VYTSRDRLGLLAAILIVIGLVWFRLGHFGSTSGTPSAQTTPTSPGASRKLVVDYLHKLQRIDAPAERLERRAGKKAMAELSKPGSVSGGALRVVAQISAGFSHAASAVNALHPPAGFENAQHLLARVYTDKAKVYQTMSQLSGASGPNQLMGVLTRLDNAVGAASTDIPNCRSAITAATTTAGVKTPAWVAGLVNRLNKTPS
jgi:hypothetical protein